MIKINFSRHFIFTLSIMLALIVFTPSAFAGYNYYNKRLYQDLGNKALEQGNYQGAVGFYQTALVYWQDTESKNKLLEAQNLEKSTENYLRGLRVLRKSQNKEAYQRAKEYFSKVISEDVRFKSAQEKIKFCEQKITEIAEAEKKAQERAATTGSTTSSQTKKRTAKSSTQSALGFFACRQDIGELITWIDCPPGTEFVQKAQEAIEVLKSKAPDYYNYFTQWVKGIRWEDSPGPNDCEIDGSIYLTCGPKALNISINMLAATFIREAAASDYAHTLPLGYFDYNDCKNYAYGKMNEVIAIIGY
jgi:tetratricopeptide (TPR) repeat protein